jgi:hypothetical protein
MSISPRVPPFIDRRFEGSVPFGFRLVNSTGFVDVAWWKGIDSSALAIYLTGFKVVSGDFQQTVAGDPNFTIQYNWRVFAGGMCAIDDEPVWEGTSWIKPFEERTGRLVQVSGLSSYEWLLQVQVVDPGVAFALQGTITWKLPDYPIIAGPQISSGNFIG